jgi:hypothetical protein
MAMQITKEGDFKATEFSELSYSGKGNGSTNYINTGIACDTINSFSIKFKFNAYSVAALYESLFGCVENSYTEYFWYRQDASVTYIYIGNGSAPVWAITGVMLEDNIYTLTMTHNGSESWTVTVYNHTTGAEVYSSTQTATGIRPSSSLYIMARNLNAGTLNYPGKRDVYWFEINGERWYVNNGSGTTLTGSNGTTLTISGTTTNFWQDTTEWNYPTNLKMFKTTDKVACIEFDEVSYCGLGNGTDVEIITTIPAQDITSMSITFKYTNYVALDAYFGSLTDANNRFCLIKYSTTNGLQFSMDNVIPFFDYTSYITLGSIYKLDLVITGTNAHTDFYKWNTTTEVFDLVYSADKTTTNNRGSYPVRIFNRTYSANNYRVDENIYAFSINGETWTLDENINGTTVTGSNGTELTISGTLTNFKQVSEIPNLNAQTKLYSTYTKIKDEMVEV